MAEYISKNLAYQLSPEDVFLTIGCSQAIEAIISVLSRPAANILLPRPFFPLYKSRADFQRLEVRHFDLIPEKNWEVDLEAIQALADHNTVAIVVINPNNPCGSVYTYHHLKQVRNVHCFRRSLDFLCWWMIHFLLINGFRLRKLRGNLGFL